MNIDNPPGETNVMPTGKSLLRDAQPTTTASEIIHASLWTIITAILV